jgi:hypothetical protein
MGIQIIVRHHALHGGSILLLIGVIQGVEGLQDFLLGNILCL